VDLYGDLYQDNVQTLSKIEEVRLIMHCLPSLLQLQEKLVQSNHELEVVRAAKQKCELGNEKLQKENQILRRNLSCVFRTAQLEIERKDAELKRLKQVSYSLLPHSCTPYLVLATKWQETQDTMKTREDLVRYMDQEHEWLETAAQVMPALNSSCITT